MRACSNSHVVLVVLAAVACLGAGPARAQEDLLPTARVVFPNLSTTAPAQAGPTVTLGWEGTDPDAPDNLPVRVRHLLCEAVTPDGQPIRTQTDYNMHYWELVDWQDEAWSPWLDYSPDEEGRRVTFTGLEPDHYYLFAVQTLDRDGAASHGLGYQVQVAHLVIRSYLRPQVVLSETYLGASGSTAAIYQVASDQPLNFSWTADAGAYGGTIVSYRYGWDLIDTGDPQDPGWSVPPGLHLSAPPRSFTSGLHSFWLRVVDDSGNAAVLERVIEVVPYVDPAFQRPLLVIDQTVDDRVMNWMDQRGIPRNDELYRNAYWHFLAEGAGGVSGFDWARDRFDHRDQVEYADLVGYRAVLCYAMSNTQQTMFGPFRPQDGVDRYVWLTPYQVGGGNLFLVGGRSMDSVLEMLPNYMTPLIFDTDEETEIFDGTSFVVGFGTREIPDGTTVVRGRTLYPYAVAGVAALDWTALNSKYIYARPRATMHQERRSDCVGLKGIVLDPAFRAHWNVAPGAIADTILTEAIIDWQDAYYDAQGTLDVVHNTFPYRDDEFVDANLSTRATPLAPQACDDPAAPGGLCIEPMFRGLARFDWLREHKWGQGDAGWPGSRYTPAQLDELCGVMALQEYGELPRGSARTNGRTFGYLSYRMTASKPSGAPDVYWGFDPYRFDNQQTRQAVRWVLQMFGVPVNP